MNNLTFMYRNDCVFQTVCMMFAEHYVTVGGIEDACPAYEWLLSEHIDDCRTDSPESDRQDGLTVTDDGQDSREKLADALGATDAIEWSQEQLENANPALVNALKEPDSREKLEADFADSLCLFAHYAHDHYEHETVMQMVADRKSEFTEFLDRQAAITRFQETSNQPNSGFVVQKQPESTENDTAKSEIRDFDDTREKLEADLKKRIVVLQAKVDELTAKIDKITEAASELMKKQPYTFDVYDVPGSIKTAERYIDELTAERDEWKRKAEAKRAKRAAAVERLRHLWNACVKDTRQLFGALVDKGAPIYAERNDFDALIDLLTDDDAHSKTEPNLSEQSESLSDAISENLGLSRDSEIDEPDTIRNELEDNGYAVMPYHNGEKQAKLRGKEFDQVIFDELHDSREKLEHDIMCFFADYVVWNEGGWRTKISEWLDRHEAIVERKYNVEIFKTQAILLDVKEKEIGELTAERDALKGQIDAILENDTATSQINKEFKRRIDELTEENEKLNGTILMSGSAWDLRKSEAELEQCRSKIGRMSNLMAEALKLAED